MDPYALADDAQAAHDWLEEQSAMPSAWLAGMADEGPRIAMARLVELNPRVEVGVGFNPYRDAGCLSDAYVDFRGAGLFLTGDEDPTSTPEIVRAWFDDLDQPRRGLFAVMQGAGHAAATDIDLEPATLSDADRSVRDLANLAVARCQCPGGATDDWISQDLPGRQVGRE
jgi:hypothetical protein